MASKSFQNYDQSSFNFSSQRPAILSKLALKAGKFSRKASLPFIQLHRLLVGKPIRDLNFWRKALHIYSSYKMHQVKSKVVKIQRIAKILPRNISLDDWQSIHEINSNRMIKLCLGLRGFYLKTGQFLGTRHDFMPKSYTVVTFPLIIV